MAASNGTLGALNSAVAVTVDVPQLPGFGPASAGTVGVNMTGTWVGTVTFEGSTDGSNWYAVAAYPLLGIGVYGSAVTTVTKNTQLAIPVGGFNQIRARMSVYTSGNAAILFDVSAGVIVTQLFTNSEGQKATYSVGFTALSPAATATDIMTLLGSATTTVRLTRFACNGLATSAGYVNITLLIRSTADTGGTSTAPALTPHDSNDAAATAVVRVYTANPTLGTLVGATNGVRGETLGLGAGTSGARVDWDFGTRNSRAIVLRGNTQQACINLQGSTIPSGTLLDLYMEFTEE